jgi:hypothetical protein
MVSHAEILQIVNLIIMEIINLFNKQMRSVIIKRINNYIVVITPTINNNLHSLSQNNHMIIKINMTNNSHFNNNKEYKLIIK